MTIRKVVYADSSFYDLDGMLSILKPLGIELIDGQCKNVKEVISLSKDAAVIITEMIPFGEELYSSCPDLKLAIRNNIGFEIMDLAAATRHGIRVCNNPVYCLLEVAEHTLAMLLCLARKLVLANQRVRAGHYDYKDLIPISRVQGSTVGFLGFGRIARLVAKKLAALDVRSLFFDPYVTEENIDGAAKASMEETLKAADYLCLHMPLTPETRHLINAQTLALMQPNACLINMARGEVIDTAALIHALQSGRLKGAALDVLEEEKSPGPESPLCTMDNVILTPHSAWYSEEAMKQNLVDLAQEIARFFNNEPLQALLNPEVLKR